MTLKNWKWLKNDDWAALSVKGGLANVKLEMENCCKKEKKLKEKLNERWVFSRLFC